GFAHEPAPPRPGGGRRRSRRGIDVGLSALLAGAGGGGGKPAEVDAGCGRRDETRAGGSAAAAIALDAQWALRASTKPPSLPFVPPRPDAAPPAADPFIQRCDRLSSRAANAVAWRRP